MTPALLQINTGLHDLTVDSDLPAVVNNQVRILREKENVDIVIALTHIGARDDAILAKQVDGIDVICGGHTHHYFPKKKPLVIKHSKEHLPILPLN